VLVAGAQPISGLFGDADTGPIGTPTSVEAARLLGGLEFCRALVEIAILGGVVLALSVSVFILRAWRIEPDTSCAIMDCFSRMIVARTFSTTADTALVNNAVNTAGANRNRRGATILHADHGTQFTS
jgi:transposase InsO family protein